MTTSETFQNYVRVNWGTDRYSEAIMACGAAGETGEYLEHFKKVLRDYNGDFSSYPEDKRKEALLEFGDALHYMTRIAQEFGFTLEQIMQENMRKLNARYKRPFRAYGEDQ